MSCLTSSPKTGRIKASIDHKAGLRMNQVIAAVANAAGQLSSGYGIGYLGPHGKEVKADLGMSDTDITWAVSSLLVGGIPGCLVAGWIADTIGRRKSLFVCYIVSTLGWALVSMAATVSMLVAGRVMHGLGEAMVVVISNMYLGEMVGQKYKGAILCSLSVACWAGTTLVYTLGVLLGWREGAGLGVGINAVGIVCLGFVPESPHWLARKLLETETCTGEDDENIEEQESSINTNMISPTMNKNTSTTSNMMNQLKNISKVTILIPPLLLLITPLNGGFSMAFFAIDLVSSMGFSHPALLSILIALLRTVGIVFSMIFVQKFGRRNSLLVSSSVVTVCCFIISSILYTNLIPKLLSDWIMIIILLTSMFTSGLGISSIPWVLASEWPEMNMKAFVNTASTFCYFVSVFLSAQITTLINSSFGISASFMAFAGINALTFIVTFMYVVETGGLTYERHREFEIQKNKEDPDFTYL